MDPDPTMTSEVYRLSEDQCELSGWTLVPDPPTDPPPDRPSISPAPGSYEDSDEQLSSASYGSSCEELEEYIPRPHPSMMASQLNRNQNRRAKVMSSRSWVSDQSPYADLPIPAIDYIVTVEPESSGTDTLIKIKYLNTGEPPTISEAPVLSSKENIRVHKQDSGVKTLSEPRLKETLLIGDMPERRENDDPGSDQGLRKKKKASDKKLKEKTKKVSFSCGDVNEKDGASPSRDGTGGSASSLTSQKSSPTHTPARLESTGVKRKRSPLAGKDTAVDPKWGAVGSTKPTKKAKKARLDNGAVLSGKTSRAKKECGADSISSSLLEPKTEPQDTLTSVGSSVPAKLTEEKLSKSEQVSTDRALGKEEKDIKIQEGEVKKQKISPQKCHLSPSGVSELLKPLVELGEHPGDKAVTMKKILSPKSSSCEELKKGLMDGQLDIALSLASLSQQGSLNVTHEKPEVTLSEKEQVLNAVAILLKKNLKMQIAPPSQTDSSTAQNPLIVQVKVTMGDEKEEKEKPKEEDPEEPVRKSKGRKASEPGRRVRMLGGVRQEDGSWMCECGMQFKFSSGLSRHRRIKHLGVVYICAVCKKQFTRSDSLSEHMKRQHAMNLELLSQEIQKKGWPVYSASDASQLNTPLSELKPVTMERKKRQVAKGLNKCSQGKTQNKAPAKARTKASKTKIQKSKKAVSKGVSDKKGSNAASTENLIETKRLLSMKTKYYEELTVMDHGGDSDSKDGASAGELPLDKSGEERRRVKSPASPGGECNPDSGDDSIPTSQDTNDGDERTTGKDTDVGNHDNSSESEGSGDSAESSYDEEDEDDEEEVVLKRTRLLKPCTETVEGGVLGSNGQTSGEEENVGGTQGERTLLGVYSSPVK